VRHSAIEADALGDARLNNEAQVVRDRLHYLLKSLDELIEPIEHCEPATADRVRAILRSRRLRDRFFEAGLFADPAWDILLELYLAELGQYRLAISSLCLGAAVPATTALRWIKTLEKKGLVVRSPDPDDGRRIYVALANDAAQAMERLFSAVPAAEQLL
jgi:DNA-binding MarR family transcriptional regulator